MPAWLIALLIPLGEKLLPIILGELGGLIKRFMDRSKPLVEQAAKDGTLPDGAARHQWVKDQLLDLQTTGVGLLPIIVNGAADVAIKSTYDKLQTKKK